MYFGCGRHQGAATYHHDELNEPTKPATGSFLLGIYGCESGATGNGFWYACEAESFWFVNPPPPTAGDKLKGPFPTLLSAVNTSIANPKIFLDSELLPDDTGEAIAQAICGICAQIVLDRPLKLNMSIGHSGTYAAICEVAGRGHANPLKAINCVHNGNRSITI